jgi:CRP/FNR family transcriptional regulator
MNSVSEINHDLRILPCLSGLGDDDLAIIGRRAELKRITRNDVLFSESDPVRFFFVLRTGAVKLFKTSKDGRELIIRTMKPGDYFCCAPLFDGERSLANAVAVEDSTLIVIPSDKFKEMLCGSVGEIGLKVIVSLCAKIKHLSSLVEDLTFKDVEHRVLMTLLSLSEERSPKENVVALSVSHHDIASMTGTVREVVSRVMSRLKKEGIITESSIRSFKIDKERLSSVLNKRYPLPPSRIN